MASFWKHIGKAFAKVAQGAAFAATWASTHPEVVTMITQIAATAGK